MINTTDEKILLESNEPAFMVLGSTSFEEPGHAPDVKKRTTIFTLRGNAKFDERVGALKGSFIAAQFGEATTLAYETLIDFEREVCRRVCAGDAHFHTISSGIHAIVWTRDVLKGGKA